VGKWHLGHSKWSMTPLSRGFDSFFGLHGGGFDHYTKVGPWAGGVGCCHGGHRALFPWTMRMVIMTVMVMVMMMMMMR
jgi:arylsulfatase A-like enzyme